MQRAVLLDGVEKDLHLFEQVGIDISGECPGQSGWRDNIEFGDQIGMKVARIGELEFIGGRAIQAAFADLRQQVLGGEIVIREPLQRGQIPLCLAQRRLMGRSGRHHQFSAFQIGKVPYARPVVIAYQHLAHTLVGGAKLQSGRVVLPAHRNSGKMCQVFA